MSDIQHTESKRKPMRWKLFILAGLTAVLIALLIRPVVRCPVRSTAQVVHPAFLPEITLPQPTNQQSFGGTVFDQPVEADEITQLQALDAERAKLNTHVAEERQRIETWYANALTQLKVWAQEREKELDGTEKAAWAWCLQQIQNTQTQTDGRMTTNTHSRGSGYVSPGGYITGSGYSQTDGRITGISNTQVVGDPAGEYQKVLVHIKNSRASVEREFIRLKNERDRHLAELESYANQKKATIETQMTVPLP